MEYSTDDVFSDEHEENTNQTEEAFTCDKIIRASETVDRLRSYADFNGLNMLTSDNAVFDLISMMKNYNNSNE